VFHFLKPATARETRQQAACLAPFSERAAPWYAGGRSRCCASRAQEGADSAAAAVVTTARRGLPDVAACPENLEGDIEIPNHPLVREVMKDVLTEAMDLDGLIDVLERLRDGSIKCVAVDTAGAFALLARDP
jgi:ATP-dependent Lhr-like helicase